MKLPEKNPQQPQQLGSSMSLALGLHVFRYVEPSQVFVDTIDHEAAKALVIAGGVSREYKRNSEGRSAYDVKLPHYVWEFAR